MDSLAVSVSMQPRSRSLSSLSLSVFEPPFHARRGSALARGVQRFAAGASGGFRGFRCRAARTAFHRRQLGAFGALISRGRSEASAALPMEASPGSCRQYQLRDPLPRVRPALFRKQSLD